MSRYVLDSNVAIKWMLPEVDTPQALRLRADYQAAIHELPSPDIFPVETAHALTRAERRALLPVGQAAVHLAKILNTPPQLHPYLPLLGRALDISSQARVGVYDCIYVALAEREGCELVTTDQRLIGSLGGKFPFIVELSAVP